MRLPGATDYRGSWQWLLGVNPEFNSLPVKASQPAVSEACMGLVTPLVKPSQRVLKPRGSPDMFVR
jgi:hypothetical protein